MHLLLHLLKAAFGPNAKCRNVQLESVIGGLNGHNGDV
jgi:hypothetical protein